VLVLALGVTLGLDSLRVCAVLGLRNPRGRARWVLPAAFGVSDGLALWVGMLIGGLVVAALKVGTEVTGAVALACYGGWLICMKDQSTDVKTPAWLPALLSLDNLGAGVALNSVSAPLAAVAVGTISAWMAALGLAVGAAAAKLIPASHVRRAAGLMLMAFAVLTLAGAT
jgi:putative Mn2+ efflux pump MntP